MAEELKFLPTQWMDEIQPTPQSDINNFIFHDNKFGWHMRDPDAPSSDPGDWCFQLLVEGDLICFSAHEYFGDFVLTVHSDRTFTTDRPVPEKANCFRIDRDLDTIQPTLADLVNDDPNGFPLEPGEHAMDCYWWSEEEYLFRFEIAERKGAFAACGVKQ